MLLLESKQTYDCSTAALRIAKALGFPWSILAVFLVVPRSWRDGVYNYVAKNRYRWFGKTPACPLRDPETEKRMLKQTQGDIPSPL